MTDKATPRPWRFVTNSNGTVNVVSAPDSDGWSTKVALVNGKNAADAALIVSAVNERDELVAALRKIAAFDDIGASAHLAATGSYGRFDEPGSVAMAREALAKLEPKP